MKKGILGLVFLSLLGVSAFAAQSKLGNFGLDSTFSDFVAPVVGNKLKLDTAPAGTIVFEQTTTSASGAFFGLIAGGDPTSSNSWVQLSPPSGTSAVISGGLDRIERASIDTVSGAGTINSQSGTWVSGVSRIGAGDYTLNITASTWSQAPICTCAAFDSSTYGCTNVSTTTSAVRFRVFDNSGTLQDASSGTYGFNVICQGTR